MSFAACHARARIQAKIEQRAPKVEIEAAVNIMDALKKSMQSKGQGKEKDAVRKRMGAAAPKKVATQSLGSKIASRRSAH